MLDVNPRFVLWGPSHNIGVSDLRNINYAAYSASEIRAVAKLVIGAEQVLRPPLM